MKTTQMIAAALILAASASSMAQQATDSKEIVRGKTRAEVTAELQQAQADGKTLPTGFVAFDAPAKTNGASGNTAIARK